MRCNLLFFVLNLKLFECASWRRITRAPKKTRLLKIPQVHLIKTANEIWNNFIAAVNDNDTFRRGNISTSLFFGNLHTDYINWLDLKPSKISSGNKTISTIKIITTIRIQWNYSFIVHKKENVVSKIDQNVEDIYQYRGEWGTWSGSFTYI